MKQATETSIARTRSPVLLHRRQCLICAIQVAALCLVTVTVWCIMITPALLYYTTAGQNTTEYMYNTNVSCQVSHNNESTAFNDKSSIKTKCSVHFLFVETNSNVGCRPHCGEWSSYSQSDLTASNAVIGLSMSLGILSTVFILIFSCAKRRSVYVFPTVMIVYQDVTITVLGVLVLVGFIDREIMFCPSTDLRTVFENQQITSFCSITGSVSYLALLAITVWSLIQVVWIWLSLYWPQQAKLLHDRNLYRCSFHITALLAGLLSPLIPIAVTFGTGGFSVLGTRFPPILCIAADRSAIIGSLVVPLSVLLSIIVTLLVLVVHFLFKRSKFATCHWKTETSNNSMGLAPTVKVLIVCCYYIFLGFGASLAYTLSSRNLPHLKNELFSYLECEKCGMAVPSVNHTGQMQCDRSGFEQYTSPVLETIAFSLLGIYPVFTLVYIIKCSSINIGRNRKN